MSRQVSRVFRRSALTLALGVCFASTVQAQSNTAGSVFGQAAVGETILIENPATGFRRQISVSADGTYRVVALQPGTYRVTATRADGTTSVRDDIIVNAGVGTPVNFGAGGGGVDATVGAVTVTGTRAINPIDVSSVESATILTAAQIAKIPVARDTTSVALLAPGTVKGDAAFGNLASFGGSSVAENQYYVNGFNITNSFRSLNFSQVPFEAIQEQQIKTGGYGAEFGRSLGGVVNQITKRGTNEFHAGGNVFYTPEQYTAHRRDIFLTNGSLREYNAEDESWNATASAWASGALIKDKLFAYGLIQYNKTESDTWGSVLSGSNTNSSFKRPNYLLKMDWNINDANLLELTAFSDKGERSTAVYRNGLGVIERGDLIGTNYTETGGDNYVLKYTGYFTDSFTLSALYGHGQFSRSQHLRTANGLEVEYGGDLNNPASGCPVIVDARPGYRRAATGTYSSTCNITGGSIDRVDSEDTRDQFRIDADWMLGDHQLRFGFDLDDYESVAGQSIEGGRTWRYATVNPDAVANNGDEFDVVREQIVNQGATVQVKQRAFYVQDNWSITDNFMAYMGLRWDSFENLNGQGQTYVDIKNQLGPRLGFSWDVNSDSTFKIYGNAGRYALPLTPSVAVRGASASLFTRQQFTYTGVDPVTGAPIGIVPRTNSTGELTYINGEFGEPKNPATIASQNLDPMYQDEYILGFQKSLTDNLSFGLRTVYRDLKTAIDDNCDYTAITELAEADGLTPNLPNAGFPYCRMFNPGQDAVFLTDVEGDGTLTRYTVKGSRLSPEARRTYKAAEFFLDGAWDKFFMQASYTWSQSKGNTEGGVKSDIGQADTSVTQDFDYKELTVDTYGFLPNDRRHSLKVFGNYEFTEEWSVGANLLVQSGRPINCFGTLTLEDGSLHPYGASFMRCGGEPRPRGTSGRLPWTNSIDLNVAYRPSFMEGLQFKLDVFNVMNHQKVTSVSEIAEDGATGNALETYLMPTSYQAPRSVRFMIQYDF